jgi:DNA-binding beta-propeller fold protein YncE
MAGMAGMDHGDHTSLAPSNTCSPTWAQPSVDGALVWVACNRANDIVEVDVASWTERRRIPTPAAPYSMAVSADGKLAAITQKGPATITLWSLPGFTLVAEVPGTRKVASGLTFSADGRFLFATLEGIGGQPGTVDIIDVTTHAKVASVDTGKQAGGIAMLP